MSVQIVARTRPPRGSRRGSSGRSPGAARRPAAERLRGLRDEHVGEHVREVRDGREDRVVRVGRRSPRAGRRGRAAAGGAARTACRRSFGVGVRYQVAPSNRSARACWTPAVSAPASGWPPTKRGSSCAATTARLVEPTSVTTQSRGAAASASPTAADERPDGDRDEHRLGVGDRVRRPSAQRRSSAPRSRRWRERLGRRRRSRRRSRRCARARRARPSRRSARRR